MSADIVVRGSILRRLLVLLLAGAAVLALALFFIVQSLSRQLAQESQDDVLAAAAAAILDGVIARDGVFDLDLPYLAFSMLSSRPQERVFYAVYADEQFKTGYQDLVPATLGATAVPAFETRAFRGTDVRSVTSSRKVALEGEPVDVTVILAQTRDGQAQSYAQILRMAAMVGAGFFASVALLAVLAARASIRPLARLAESVARRGPQDLRPVAAPVPSEMKILVGALNTFMERLKTSLARSEDFIAEAAHRVRTPLATVRTPLATVRTQAEITLRRVEKEENRATVREMIRAIDESSRAAGQILDHAMVSFRSDHIEPEKIGRPGLAQDMVERLRPLADMRDVDLRLCVDAAPSIMGDSILVQSALRNLLDNAIKYSPPETAVDVTVGSDDGWARLQVRDRGIGFPKGSGQGLTSRFARGENVEGIVGSGLGLTIVDDVARAHGGRLQIDSNQKGPGACVSLFFPLA